MYIYKLFCQTLFKFMKFKKFNDHKKDNIIHSITLSLIISEEREEITEFYVINQQIQNLILKYS